MSEKTKNKKPLEREDDQVKIEADPEITDGSMKIIEDPAESEEATENEEDPTESSVETDGAAEGSEQKEDLKPRLAADLTKEASESVLIFRARIPLTDAQFKQLQKHVESEEERTGYRIVLMPYSCEVGE